METTRPVKATADSPTRMGIDWSSWPSTSSLGREGITRSAGSAPATQSVASGAQSGPAWIAESDGSWAATVAGIAAMLANSKSAGTTALPTISLVPGPGVFPAARIIDRGRDTPR